MVWSKYWTEQAGPGYRYRWRIVYWCYFSSWQPFPPSRMPTYGNQQHQIFMEWTSFASSHCGSHSWS